MVKLVIVACLTQAPDQCIQRELLIEPLTLMQCIYGAPPEMVNWRLEHPNYRITRFWCSRG